MYVYADAPMKDNELFVRANKEYLAGNFTDALQLYEKMSSKGFAVWYNMGNAFYHNGDNAKAILYWRIAQQMSNPLSYKHAENNILQARKESSNANWMKNLINKIRWMWMGISRFWVQFIFLVTWYGVLIIQSIKWTRMRFIQLGCSIVAFIIVVCIIDAAYAQRERHVAVVMADTCALYSGPDERYHVLQKLDKTVEVEVQEAMSEWYKIRVDGEVGWIKKEMVESIPKVT